MHPRIYGTWECFLFCYYRQNKILRSPDLRKFPLEDSLQHIHTGIQSYFFQFQNVKHIFISPHLKLKFIYFNLFYNNKFTFTITFPTDIKANILYIHSLVFSFEGRA